MVSSATAAELRPGTLATSTPRAAAAAVSMVLVPGAGPDDQREPVGRLEHTAFTLVLRTTSTSKPAIRPGEVLGAEARLHHALMTAGLEVDHGLVRERVGEE